LAQVHQKLFDSYLGKPVHGLLPAVKECLSDNICLNGKKALSIEFSALKDGKLSSG